jgi:hypothetical protein
MTLQVDVRADVEAAEKSLFNYERRVIPKATARALNTTARNVKTQGQRDIAKITGLKVGEVGKEIWLSRATWGRLVAIVNSRRRAFNLIRFVAPSKRAIGAFIKAKGVKANPWRRSKVFDGTFIIRGETHGRLVVVARTSSNRYPLKGIYGPSIHIEFNRPAMRRALNVLAATRFSINFRRDLAYFVARANQ